MPTFEDDLRQTREARGRTLDQIQQETRIPVDVLRRFEQGQLAQDPAFNEVYLKAFLRSYARAVGVPQADVLAAYDATRHGTYRGRLHPDHDPASEPAPPEPALPAPAAPAAAPGLPTAPPPARPAAPPTSPDASLTPVQALRAGPPASALPPAASVRIARPAVPGARRSYDKNWSFILALFAAVVLALGMAVYWLVFRDADVPEAALVSADGVAAQIDRAAVGAGAAGRGPQFQTPITVVVTASGDGLQSFSVSADGDRAPSWINAGASRTFAADSALVLWGEGTSASFRDATVEVQGLRWTPADGVPVTISAATGQRLLDSLSAAGPAAASAP